MLQLRELPEPVPRRDDVRVKVLATAVTSTDCLIRSLELPVAMRMAARLAVGTATLRRLVLGLVLAREIDTAGKDVSRFTEGDRVFGFDRFAFGCYAECKCTAETGVLTAQPSNLSYEQAAAIPYGRLTRKSALIRYKDWIWRSTEQDSPWGGGGEPVPAAPVRAPAERFLADAILVSGDYRQHNTCPKARCSAYGRSPAPRSTCSSMGSCSLA